jgi:hypothetical protein
MRALLEIGVNPTAVKEARAAIMDILRCSNAEEETKRHALAVLQEICRVNGTVIKDCTFTGR